MRLARARADMPANERILRVAGAALLLAMKKTSKATKRCRRRRLRALELLGDNGEDKAAAAWLRRTCEICMGCEGVGVMLPRPGQQT